MTEEPTSDAEELDEPLEPTQVRRLTRDIVARGDVRLSRHAREQMAQRNLTEVDVSNTLRGGWVDENRIEYVSGSWRYGMTTHRMCFVIAFRSTTTLVVVSGWRKSP